MLYSAVLCIKLRVSQSNLIPGLVGLVITLYAALFPKIYDRQATGIFKGLKYIINAAIAFCGITFVGMCLSIFAVSQSVPDPGREAVIVLGAGLKGDRVTKTLSLRLDQALEYHAQNPSAVIVVSGGQGPDEWISEAAAMKGYLMARGVDEQQIIAEDKSTSTKENFDFSRKLLDAHFAGKPYKIVYVTNDFHLMRAGFYAKKAGYEDAQGLAAPSLWYMLPNYYTREYLAVMKYFALEHNR